MTRVPDLPLRYARSHRGRFVSELKDFIRFLTVSSQPKHAPDLKRCAQWLAVHLRRVGLRTTKILGTNHPIVYADWRQSPGRPTVLIYGHYDVQPADPLHEWQTPPFEPAIRGNYLFGRGACDDKGQMFTHVKALESYLQTQRKLPVNIKCLFEGEEEIGSPQLKRFLERNRVPLSADVAVMSDMPIPSPHQPAITYALRGGLSVELEVTGPRRDLHYGKVAIPGFYDRVRQWSSRERDYMRRTGPSDDKVLRDAEDEQAWGEQNYSLYERTTLRPALTVNGISGGYQGPGGKGVIPARGLAKLSFRLVPDQDPLEIDQLVRRHVARICPPTVHAELCTLSRSDPALVDRSHPALRAAFVAYRKGFGQAPRFLRCGGTVPIVNTIQETLGIPTVLMGFALPDDHIHAPNERFYLPNFFNGIATSIWFLSVLGAMRRRSARSSVDTRSVHDH